jgi:hypothetical protein
MAKSTIKEKDLTKQFIKELEEIDGAEIEVGIFDSDIATYAAANEYGTDKAGRNKSVTIPERSFLRSTVDSKKTDEEIYDGLARIYEDKKFDAKKTLKTIGVFLVAEVKKKILSNMPPPNAPSTIEKKGSSRTLVDQGMLHKAIEARIKK